MKKFKYSIYLNYLLKRKFTENKIDLNRYLKEVNFTLNFLNDYLEQKDYPITENLVLADGVLKIIFSGNKNYVLNIQRPNLQLWLSSPISGPQRFEFDLVNNSWINNRTGKELYTIMQEEINSILKENKIAEVVDFSQRDINF